MQSASQLAGSPFEWWLQANLAAMSAGLDLVKASADAMTGSISAHAGQHRSGDRLEQTPAPALRPTNAKSWYRAPYRSPFDPLFWAMPGHPIDHVSDWFAPVLSATGLAYGNPFASAFTNGLAAWPQSAWTSAWTIPVAPWMAVAAPTFAGHSRLPNPDNVVDFAAAFSAFRTAGGHAAAPILKARASKEPEPRGLTREEHLPNFWALLFPMLPWVR